MKLVNILVGICVIIILVFILDLPDFLFGVIGFAIGLTLHFLSFITKKRNTIFKINL